MKVLFVVHGFPPAQHSGTFRSASFARYLPEFDIQPLVVCASDPPDLLTYSDQAETSAPPENVVACVDWKLKALSRTPTQRVLRRFPLGWTLAQRQYYRAVIHTVIPTLRRVIREHRPAVLYASSPPPAALLLAASASRETSVPYMCDLRDPWSYYSWARYRHFVDFLFERALERKVLMGAAAVIANTPTARSLLVTELGIPESKVHVLTNGYDEEDFSLVPPIPPQPRDEFVVVYTGLFSHGPPRAFTFRDKLKKLLGVDYMPLEQDPETRSPTFFLQGAAELLGRHPEYRRVLKIRFVGSFDEHTRAVIRGFPYQDVVEILPPVPKKEVIRITMNADVCLLLQIEMKRRGRDFCTSIPGKFFDYLRAGVPILAPMQPSDTTRLIEELGAGWVVPPRDSHAISNTLESALREWQTRGRVPRRLRIPGLERFDRRRLTEELAQILRCAAGTVPGA